MTPDGAVRQVTTWQIAFSRFHRPDFTKRELIDYVTSVTEKESLPLRKGVIERDVDCFLHCYSHGSAQQKVNVVEETFGCPLLELNLIQLSPDGELYRFAIGPKPSLPSAVFGYALCQHFERVRSDRNTMSIQECLYGQGSPGQAFRLDENSVIEYVERLKDSSGDAFVLDETAGLKQIYRKHKRQPMEFLANYYQGNGRR